MPLIKRLVEPTELSRGKLEDGLRNELEAVSVKTLCGVMRQLSSLSKHAEDMFGELCNEATNIFQRTNSLHERIQNLSLKVTQLDSNVEERKLRTLLYTVYITARFVYTINKPIDETILKIFFVSKFLPLSVRDI